MSKQTLFKDIGKRTSDLFTKEFPSEKVENKIEWKGEAPKNVTIETNLLQRKDGSIVGTFTPKYKTTWNGWLLSFLAELNTRKEFKEEVSFEGTNQNVDGLKTTVTAQSKDDENWGTLGVEYRQELYTIHASADYGKAKGSTVKGGFVVGHQGFFLGANSEYFVGANDDSELKEVHTQVGYTTKEFDAIVFGRLDARGEEDKNEFGATYFHNLKPDLSVGTEITFDTANADSKPKLTFGTQYKVHEDTSVKAKFDTLGKLGISFNQKYNKNTRFQLSATVDTNNLSAKNASNFGFVLALSD